MTTDTRFTPATIAACQAVTGLDPADLLGLVRELGDALYELQVLCRTLHTASDPLRPCPNAPAVLDDIHALSGLGWRTAGQLAEYANDQHDALRAALGDAA